MTLSGSEIRRVASEFQAEVQDGCRVIGAFDLIPKSGKIMRMQQPRPRELIG